jgi:DNA-binding transcriptional LysR family regulator
MLIKNLEYLVALAREQHFARAAAACDVTQPTLSAGIRQLEEEMGVLIVERGQRFERLTPEGERVLAWAQRILSDVASLGQEVSAMKHGLSGRLRIGAVPTALPVIALFTTPFARRHPEVAIDIRSLSSIEIQRGLDAFELDVGFSYLDNEPLARVRSARLFNERYIFVSPADGPFGRRSAVTWREAAGTPLCVLTPDMQNRRIVDRHFREAGATPHIMVETNSMATLCSHVLTGAWSSVLPESILYMMGPVEGVHVAALTEPEAAHMIGVIVHERDPLSPIASAFYEIASRVDATEVIASRSFR